MDYSLAREIYGKTPLLVDGSTFSALFSLVNDFRLGVEFKENSKKNNSFTFIEVNSESKIITNTRELNSASNEDLIYIINLNGPITKNGGASSYGMKELAAMIPIYESDNRIKGGIIIADSGGGSSLGMEVMIHAISIKKKPLVSLVERAGGANSAAYGIIAATDYIFAESPDSEVGSVGTLVSFAGRPNKSIGSDGTKQVTIYATASTKKNKWVEEAINNDDYTLAVTEVLDPYNGKFQTHIRTSRTNVKESQLDGSVYRAGDVIGSMVDEIGDLNNAKSKVMELSSLQENKLIINDKTKLKAMTAQEIQQQHPEAYAAIYGAGVTAERDRVETWMIYFKTDSEAVKTGIESGSPITGKAREGFLLKASSSSALSKIENDSHEDLPVGESANQETELTADDKEFDAVYGKHKIKRS